MKLFCGFSEIKPSSVSSFLLFGYCLFLLPLSLYYLLTGGCVLLEWEILSVSGTFISLSMVLDPVGLSFSNIVCFISGCVMMFSSCYMEGDAFLGRFTWLVMLFVLSMNLLVFIPSLISLLVGWDGLGIVSFALVVYYQNMKSLSAGMLTALANRVGDVMILLAIGLCVFQGHWNVLFMWDSEYSWAVAFCVVVAGMTKSAQIPFSSWLPAAMAAPTPVSALVHSSTLVTAGVFLLIRFFPFLSEFYWFKSGLLFVSVMTMLMAGVGASYEYDLKKVIALSTLSQLGVMMMSLALGMPFLALFHLYTHALFKAMLFLCGGAVIHNNGDTQDLRSLGGLWGQMPLTVACLNVANLSLCGAPFLSGFYSKDLILESGLYSPCNGLMLVFIFLATGMTIAYSVRLSIYLLWGCGNHGLYHQNYDEHVSVTYPILVLSVVTLFGGSFIQSLFIHFDELVVLPVEQKFLVLVVSALGGWFSFMVWGGSVANWSVGSSLSRDFNSQMWFLAPLSTQGIVKAPLMTSLNMFKCVDQGWFEVVGGHGIFSVVVRVSQYNQVFQSKALNAFIMMVVFSSFMILVSMYMSL
uniref:NADH-ubiquinone oxidoreductase chain 5 n=1 Tax=Granata lyrata TaxID=479586 RepID=A0A0S1F5M5_GRALY|nr:NADH dehydrogenase subunit 5 [Granata lyrata]ALK03367.1 NADH dehydrogenase subunit 5 [Granata lyrata]